MTRRLRKLCARSPADRRLLAHAVVLHTAIVVALRVIGFGRLRQWGSALYNRRRDAVVEPADASRIAWAVSTAATIVPFGRTCLSEALTMHWLLAGCGHESRVRFGVARAPSARFLAHAWLESASLAGDAAGYAPLTHPEVRP